MTNSFSHTDLPEARTPNTEDLARCPRGLQEEDISYVTRRERVSFDAYHFEKEKSQGRQYTMREAFQHICDVNLWGADESLSGEGSTHREVSHLKDQLTELIKLLQIQVILDAPCGDFGWLSEVSFSKKRYIGVDILSQFIEHHKLRYKENPTYQFVCADIYQFICADISKDDLPTADLILCRDCLVHFSFEESMKTLQNFKRSGSKYLLTTTFTACEKNADIITGDWRLLNLELPPFNFQKPEKIIIEGCVQSGDLYADKSFGI